MDRVWRTAPLVGTLARTPLRRSKPCRRTRSQVRSRKSTIGYTATARMMRAITVKNINKSCRSSSSSSSHMLYFGLSLVDLIKLLKLRV